MPPMPLAGTGRTSLPLLLMVGAVVVACVLSSSVVDAEEADYGLAEFGRRHKPDFPRLHRWLKSNKAVLHKNLRYKYINDEIGSGGFAVGPIKNGEKLLNIPPSLYLTVDNIKKRATRDKKRKGHDKQLQDAIDAVATFGAVNKYALAVAMYYEYLMGKESFFFPYFDVLPYAREESLHVFTEPVLKNLRSAMGQPKGSDLTSPSMNMFIGTMEESRRLLRVAFTEVLPKYPALFPPERLQFDALLDVMHHVSSRVNYSPTTNQFYIVPGMDSINHQDGAGPIQTTHSGTYIMSTKNYRKSDMVHYSYNSDGEEFMPGFLTSGGIFSKTKMPAWRGDFAIYPSTSGDHPGFFSRDSKKTQVFPSEVAALYDRDGSHLTAKVDKYSVSILDSNLKNFLCFVAAPESTSMEKLVQRFRGEIKCNRKDEQRVVYNYAKHWEKVSNRILKGATHLDDLCRDTPFLERFCPDLRRIVEWERMVATQWMKETKAKK